MTYTPRPGSKNERVWNLLLDGEWHTGSELHLAMGGWAWTFDSCIAQFRAKGVRIESEAIPGRVEFRYRMVPPHPEAATEAVAEVADTSNEKPGGEHNWRPGGDAKLTKGLELF